MVKAVVSHRGVLLIAEARWIDFIAFTYTDATRSLTRRHRQDAEPMLKTLVVAVLAIAMSVGVAEARGRGMCTKPRRSTYTGTKRR